MRTKTAVETVLIGVGTVVANVISVLVAFAQLLWCLGAPLVGLGARAPGPAPGRPRCVLITGARHVSFQVAFDVLLYFFSFWRDCQ